MLFSQEDKQEKQSIIWLFCPALRGSRKANKQFLILPLVQEDQEDLDDPVNNIEQISSLPQKHQI